MTQQTRRKRLPRRPPALPRVNPPPPEWPAYHRVPIGGSGFSYETQAHGQTLRTGWVANEKAGRLKLADMEWAARTEAEVNP